MAAAEQVKEQEITVRVLETLSSISNLENSPILKSQLDSLVQSEVVRRLQEIAENTPNTNTELELVKQTNVMLQEKVDLLTKQNADLKSSIDELNSLFMDLVNIVVGE